VIKILVACDENRVIGKDNQLIWHLPADLKRFKSLTTGHVILMGRKTYESIGKPLPNRTTIVITRQADFQAEGTIIAHSVDEAILKAKSLSREDIFIVGGAEIYTVSMALADQILLTQLHDIFEGDAFFPEISPETWEIVDRERGLTDEKNPFQYSFITYQKKDGTEN
jgi:dihydrofolate reductase